MGRWTRRCLGEIINKHCRPTGRKSRNEVVMQQLTDLKAQVSIHKAHINDIDGRLDNLLAAMQGV